MDYFAESAGQVGANRRSPHQDSRGATLAQKKDAPLLWVGVWILCSAVPVLPFAQPLWAYALADTPYAYLVWIPAFAFFWAAWSLLRMEPRTDDPELSAIMGVPLMVFTGLLFLGGMTVWSGTFVGNSAGLLLWPLWALSLAWVLFGVRVTASLLRPLAYLTLGWPPFYATIVNLSNPVLENLAVHVSDGFARVVPWIQVAPGYGLYAILHQGRWIPVEISTVCSGSDSFLAMLILLPIILVLFEGTLPRKLILVAVAAVMAVAMNLARLLLLMMSAHWAGSRFTFGILHPVLGIVLFIAALVLLMLIGRPLGLRGKTVRELRINLRPGLLRAFFAGVGTVALTVMLWPIYQWGAGSFGTPVPVTTDNLAALMPNIPGYSRSSLGLFNDSSILGPGSFCQAFSYNSSQGQYIMAEEWWTHNLSALQTYGVNNCLLFHGFKVLGTQQFAVRPGVNAQAFAILLPPAQLHGVRDAYYDVSYLFAAKYRGHNVYLRAEFMTPLQYGVRSDSPLVSAMPVALTDLFHGSRVTAGQRKALSGMTAFNFSQKSDMLAFQTFIRAFAARTMQPRAQSTNA